MRIRGKSLTRFSFRTHRRLFKIRNDRELVQLKKMVCLLSKSSHPGRASTDECCHSGLTELVQYLSLEFDSVSSRFRLIHHLRFNGP